MSDDNLTDYNNINTFNRAKQDMFLGVYGGLGLGQGMFLKMLQYSVIFSICFFLEIQYVNIKFI